MQKLKQGNPEVFFKKKIYKRISYWLFICYVFALVLVLIGGMTRLSDSGLSIVKWDLIYGIFPPLSQEDWQNFFESYQESLEYQQRYKDSMTLEDFKFIFWPEYFHRFFARILGFFVFLIPFTYIIIRYFLLLKILNRTQLFYLIFLPILGFFQAFLGWMMVKTGLNFDTAYLFGNWVRVNPYSLFLHLFFAFVIILYLLYLIFKFQDVFYEEQNSLKNSKNKKVPQLKYMLYILMSFISITVFFGTLVAGMKAGLFYQSFPLMHGYYIPPDLFRLTPWFSNFLRNQVTVQFFHRIFAIGSIAYLIFFFVFQFSYFKNFVYRIQRLFYLNFFLGCFQFLLGILTLLNFRFPILLNSKSAVFALMHQLFAFIWISVIFSMYYFLFISPRSSTRN